ncbi:hypothetical protein SODALDRAFT_382366 [Sodiomyces alkalinus F11]|uniref:BZIP domain-containing protein n=1 Tax=Sodiomyces alkalinus (strain CBS 110278 / VKM F-3762 / F11) TaxID=1314773 RepID=A0A3N2PJ69_SODAK|nr:hypothetical protein SODALDRAFT_382366 [Sodiomyces alkalinus F11]ROT34569.1 hypothetical protein SODALDRAFT_382366 [Sodiomyces alkalinus F11]
MAEGVSGIPMKQMEPRESSGPLEGQMLVQTSPPLVIKNINGWIWSIVDALLSKGDLVSWVHINLNREIFVRVDKLENTEMSINMALYNMNHDDTDTCHGNDTGCSYHIVGQTRPMEATSAGKWRRITGKPQRLEKTEGPALDLCVASNLRPHSLREKKRRMYDEPTNRHFVFVVGSLVLKPRMSSFPSPSSSLSYPFTPEIKTTAAIPVSDLISITESRPTEPPGDARQAHGSRSWASGALVTSLHRSHSTTPSLSSLTSWSNSYPLILPPLDATHRTMTSIMASPPAELPKLVGSMTTKEWVIPPRPKPGRKPATDTPPTKRKAQNRAAQRAFRERRAARVNELEGQLEEQQEAHDKKEAEYKERILQLEMEVQSHKSRCEVLQDLLDQERKDRVKAETQLDSIRRRWDSQDDASGHFPVLRRTLAPSSSSSLGNLPSVHRPGMGSHGHSPVDQVRHMETSSSGSFTCGSCGPTGRCACAETVIKSIETGCGKCGPGNRCDCAGGPLQSTLPDLKRPPASPTLPPIEKRQRSDWNVNVDDSAIEIDFTSYFKKPQPQSLHPPAPSPPAMPSGPVHDPCGFCKEGDYCVCAEAVPFSQQTQTPPPEADALPSMPIPMEVDADGAVKLRPRQSAAIPKTDASSRGCGPGGPGTCAQCIADPVSGLFCRALSANISRQGANGGCCGGGGAAGGCCKSGNASSSSGPKAEERNTGFGLSLSCAEAYQTLSSHRNFSKATDDIGSWLPKLRAAPRAGATLPSPTASSRLPIEVEAASIMSVLKDFDIRFGRGL